jgi:nucleoside-diphosphate-sugar epimerase
MRVLITGAGGFIGRALTTALVQHFQLANRGGVPENIDELLLLDVHLPQTSGPRQTLLQGNLSSPDVMRQIAQWQPDSVFHLAAVLTSAAEQDPAQALAVNVLALTELIDAIGNRQAPPRLIFPSSIAVFGGLLPDQVDDDHVRLPQTSYGTHKAIAELMLADATRRSQIDARALRLPIVLVHPGPPTASVSDRLAAMVRDSAAGKPSICPLRPDTKVPVVSVQTVARNLITLHNADPAKLRGKRVLNQPALTVSMTDIIEALERVLDGGVDISFAPDPDLKKIVDGWPKGFISTRAPSLGIAGDRSFDDIVALYLDQLAAEISRT